MTCEEIREAMLCDLPVAPEHLSACGECQRLAERLVALSADYRSAIPASAGPAAFLRQLDADAPRPVTPPRRWQPHSRWIVAASLLLFIGVGLSAPGTAPRAQSAEVIDRLLDWNLSLTSTESLAERQQLLADRQAQLRTDVTRAGFVGDEQDLAESLMANASWLAGNDDPLSNAERFQAQAGLLLNRLERAVGRGDEKAIQQIIRRYDRLQKTGVTVNRDRVTAKPLDADKLRRLERLAARDAELAARADPARKTTKGAKKAKDGKKAASR